MLPSTSAATILLRKSTFLYALSRGKLFLPCAVNFSGKTPPLMEKAVTKEVIPFPSTFTDINAENWVARLKTEDQKILLAILQKHVQSITNDSAPVSPLTTKQLFHVGLHYSLPFIGFGFLDNFIMIIAGDYIDLTIGTMLGISTLAAAALGNAISDVAGVGSAQFVESLSRKLGVPQPNLDARQFSARSTTWAINIGRAIGVSIGCVLGMIPLLFLPTSESKKNRNKDSAESLPVEQ